MATGSSSNDSRRVAITHVAYGSPTALDTSIKDRLASAARASPYSIAEMRRHIAYDRLLARVFLRDPDGWVLKGGTGLLARIPGVARHTADVDLFRNMSTGDLFNMRVSFGQPPCRGGSAVSWLCHPSGRTSPFVWFCGDLRSMTYQAATSGSSTELRV